MGKNPKAEQLQQMMSDVDIFGNGGITFDDFLYIMAQNTSQVNKHIKKTFNFLVKIDKFREKFYNEKIGIGSGIG